MNIGLRSDALFWKDIVYKNSSEIFNIGMKHILQYFYTFSCDIF